MGRWSVSSEHVGADAIAIIGTAGRFPGAANVDEFWRNLCDATASVATFTPAELNAAGIDPAFASRADYVPRRGVVADSEMFDAEFFGFSSREAQVTDPQQRLFMEVVWEALENAGCDPDRAQGGIGLYGGSCASDYLTRLRARAASSTAVSDPFSIIFGNYPEYLVTRTSYKLNLRGPGVCINTACSTSLVATVLACQGLLNGDCDIAIAGAAAVNYPVPGGYLFVEGGIMSPDGVCRAFDAEAQGTVGGNGVAVVVLKRLEDALAAGDSIVAVIRGYAINNDGGQRVGFTAPSIKGQAQVICEALATAGISAETVSYVEAHGTGTSLGDPIEVEALTQAYRSFTDKKQYCALGSVKTNIGHLDTAAGVAGLIKTALSLKHGVIPASLHYRSANPRIDFAGSPFYVNERLQPWPGAGPRRAGVSSFGIGGTNAHVILEEAPQVAGSAASRAVQILPLSARTAGALGQAAQRLATHLEERPAAELADAAYTLAVGRKGFAHRMAVVCTERGEAIERLTDQGANNDVVRGQSKGGYRAVALLLGGQGSQHVGMGAQLYAQEKVYRSAVDEASEYLKGLLGVDVRQVMHAGSQELLNQTWVTQPALYVLQWALLKQWESWGVRADALLGHSLGELVAATHAGVLTPEDGLKLVAVRGRLMWQAEPGAMLSALLSEEQAHSYVRPGLSIAAVNSRQQVVYTGRVAAIEGLQRQLDAQGVISKRLAVERAFHSELLEPIREQFLSEVGKLKLRVPQRRFISNVTGTWATAEVADAQYWWRQMREPVRFAAGVRELSKEQDWLWLELNAGAVLGRMVRTELPTAVVTSSLSSGAGASGDVQQMARALATLWTQGAALDWSGYYAEERRRRVPLPTYPFQRQRFIADDIDQPVPARAEPATVVAVVHATPNATLAPPASTRATRREMLVARIREVWAAFTGADLDAIDPAATFFQLGAESLLLMQVSRVIKDEFGVALAFRRMLEEFDSIDALAEHLDTVMPAHVFTPPAAPPPSTQSPAELARAEPATIGPAQSIAGDTSAELQNVVAEQLRIMSAQLELLKGKQLAAATATGPADGESRTRFKLPSPARDEPLPFVPHKEIRPKLTRSLDGAQQRYLADFIRRYNSRTSRSKAHVAQHRPHLADNRGIHLFRSPWKDLVYPIVGARSQGAHLWDLDGNEYVDVTMGFGVHLFGHSPAFVNEAITAQLAQGAQLGPQSYLAGATAELLAELTGMPRITFCNSGTEAVMTAIRLARAVTGRSKIVVFAGAYHGTNDSTLVRTIRETDGALVTGSAGPGVPVGVTNDTVILPYGEPCSLDFIRAHAGELAAVLVEPVQSRRPDLQPREFLQALRQLTLDTDIALIFDDIITGFRLHAGGTQAWFDVRADIATYGKVIGGGMPIGIVAGTSRYLDAIDGGVWQYGDESYPQADQIVHAGTFCKHPLAMAACHAVAQHLRAQGPQLQIDLNRTADRFVADLNGVLRRHDAPLSVVNCGSMIRLLSAGHHEHLDLLFYNVIEKGVYLWEGRTAFLSTAHTTADLQRVLDVFDSSLTELRTERVLGEPPAQPLIATTEPLRQLWALAQRDPASSRAYNETIAVTVRGAVDCEVLQAALAAVVARHQSLRSVFTNDGQFMQVRDDLPVDLETVDLRSDAAAEARLAELLSQRAKTLFDLMQGPLWRILLVQTSDDSSVLALTAHHSILDGWSSGIFLRELSACYLDMSSGAAVSLQPACPYSRFVSLQSQSETAVDAQASNRFWRERFARGVPRLALPTKGTRPAVYTYAGSREQLSLAPATREKVRQVAARHGSTQFVVLLAAYITVLARLSGEDEFVVGIHAAGQMREGCENVIGHCVSLVPLRVAVDRQSGFAEVVAACQREFLNASEHQSQSYGQIAKDLNVRRDPSRLTLVETVFNLDHSAEDYQMFGRDVEIRSIPSGSSKWDLSWNVIDSGKSLRVQCDYNSDLYRADDVRDWLTAFGWLLDALSDAEQSGFAELMAAVDRKGNEERAASFASLQASNIQRLQRVKRAAVSEEMS